LQATDSVNALFNSLFDFAKIESKGVAPRFAQMPIGEMINELSVQFGPSAQAKGLDLRLHINPAHVWTDPLLIRRIVGNLLANSIRYTSSGAVLLSTRRRGGDMWIEVRDTGQGIAPEHQPHIFREFYKASPHAGSEDGFGLGLAIVSRLCAALGHEVSLQSTLGKGTMVRVAVPITQPVSPDQLLGAAQNTGF
jgi:signal transduction histidine kinase